MSIADEMREYAKDWRENQSLMDGLDAGDVDGILDDFERIADRIDKGMGELGWVRLPVDADGKVIRIGDKLDGYGETTVVKRLTLGDDGWSMTCENGLWFDFAAFTHHHEPTVEDVLRELEGMRGNGADYETVVMRCAELAKTLRGLLADDGEEQ